MTEFHAHKGDIIYCSARRWWRWWSRWRGFISFWKVQEGGIRYEPFSLYNWDWLIHIRILQSANITGMKERNTSQIRKKKERQPWNVTFFLSLLSFTFRAAVLWSHCYFYFANNTPEYEALFFWTPPKTSIRVSRPPRKSAQRCPGGRPAGHAPVNLQERSKNERRERIKRIGTNNYLSIAALRRSTDISFLFFIFTWFGVVFSRNFPTTNSSENSFTSHDDEREQRKSPHNSLRKRLKMTKQPKRVHFLEKRNKDSYQCLYDGRI